MRECNGTPASRQAENLKSAHSEPLSFRSFVPPVCPDDKRYNRSPGFSSFASAPGGAAKGHLQDCPVLPLLVYSSILRPDQKPNLTSLLRNSEQWTYWSEAYRLDTVLRRKKTSHQFIEPKNDIPPRGKIDQFSYKSGLRLKHQVRNASIPIQSQFLLTYPDKFPTSGKIIKNHLDRWFRALRKAYGSKTFGFEWCLEFQDRGAPHFHVFFTWKVENELRRVLAKKWNAIIRGGKSHLWFHLRKKNFIPWDMGSGDYVMKYATKKEQKDVPEGFEDVGRFWGYSRNMKPIALRYDYEQLQKEAFGEWSTEEIRLYFQRTMRRYHNSKLRQFGKSSFLSSGSWSRVKVPNGTRVFHRLIEWIQQTGPPTGDMKYRVPSGPVPF